MPAPDLQDDRTGNDNLNPSAQNYEGTFNDLRDADRQAANNDRKTNENSNKSIDERENSPSLGGINTIPTTYSGAATKIVGKFTGKKKGALAGIIVFILGMLGIGSTLFTPGLGVIQMKEVLTGNLNDQLAAMDIRSNQVFKAKLSSMSSGVCTGVQIKCKFSSMTQKQVDRFKKAGFTIADEDIKSGILGRKIITSMTAPDGTVIKNPADLVKARNSSIEVRSAMKRVFNPIYYGLSDKVANTFFANNKTNKQKKVTSGTDEENRKALATATSGEGAGGEKGVLLSDPSDPDRQYVLDENGTKVYSDQSNFDSAKSAAEQRVATLDNGSSPTSKATSSLLGGAGKGISVLGVVDSACSVYNLARAVAATAKIARSMQLVQFAMVLNTTADSIKAGDATPEEVEFVGKMLSTTDSRKTIYDENTQKQIENQFYGKSAYDSPGYKTAAYNEAPLLTTQSQQYMVGGGLSGSLSTVISDIENTLGAKGPEAIRGTCGVVQNPWVRGTGLVLGVILAIGSFGVGTAISMAGSFAISFAMPFLEAMLSDVVAGNVIGENIASVEAGDAYFAGTSATLGGVAQMRGMQPMSSEGLEQYIAATSESTSNMIALEKYEDSKTPFNTAAQYSFLGMFTRSLYPTAITAKGSVVGAITSVGLVISQGFASIIKPASAAQAFNAERFSKCNDPGYEELGIDADIFCNVRYGLTASELGLDTEQVIDFMLSNDYIDESGNPKNGYKDFMDFCANRKDGWGEASTADGSTVSSELQTGKACVDGSGSTLANISYFRVYTMDKSISDAMDDEVEQQGTTAADATIDMENLLNESVSISCAPGTTDAGPETGYTNGNAVPIRLCVIPGEIADFADTSRTIRVNSRVSGAMLALFTQMKADMNKEEGNTKPIEVADSFRTYDEQVEAKRKYGRLAAEPGFSNHQMGIAIDFQLRYNRGGGAANSGATKAPGESRQYDWLTANAATYGFKKLSFESWHWSPNGK